MNKVLIVAICLVLISFAPTSLQTELNVSEENIGFKKLPAENECISAQIHKLGIVLQTDDLKAILEEDLAITGLAFKVNNNRGKTLQLELLKVYDKQMNDYSTFSSISCRINVSDKLNQVADPKFQYERARRKSEFSFAYGSRDQLEFLFAGDYPTLLLRGTTIDFGKEKGVKGDMFSFILEGYPFDKNEMYNDGNLGKPTYCVMQPCPPFWRPAGL